jgi:hypothetical protein
LQTLSQENAVIHIQQKIKVCFEKRLQTLFLSCQAKNQQFLGTPYKTYTAQNDFELLQHIIILNLI